MTDHALSTRRTFALDRLALALLLAALLALIAAPSLSRYTRSLVSQDVAGDQGVFSEFARTIVRGGVIYRDFYDNKPPGLFVFMAPFVAAFGTTPLAVKLPAVVIGLLLTGVSAALAYRLTGGSRTAALVVAALAFMYGASHRNVETTFTATMLSGCAALAVVSARGRLSLVLLGGVLFAWAALTKQPIAAEYPILLALTAWAAPSGRRLQHALVFTAGGALVGVGFLVWMFTNDVFDRIWFSQVVMNAQYVFTKSGTWHFGGEADDYFQRYFVASTLPYLLPLLLSAVAAFAALVWVRRSPPDADPHATLPLPDARLVAIVAAWVVLTLLTASVGRSFRFQYYSQSLTPMLALVGLGVVAFRRLPPAVLALGALALIPFVYRFGVHHLNLDRNLLAFDTARPVYAPIFDRIRAETTPADCIWTWGFIAHINFSSDRSPCNSAAQEGFVMDDSAFPIQPNRVIMIDELLARSPALHVARTSWRYFPALQTYADRYRGDAIASAERYTLYRVDRTMWRSVEGVAFGGEIALIGYDLWHDADAPLCPGDALDMALTWRQLSQPARQYQAFAQLQTADGAGKVAGWDGVPAPDAPTYTWVTPREPFLGETFTLTIAPDAAPGSYRLVVGLYEVETLAPLTVSSAGAAQGAAQFNLLPLTLASCPAS